MSKPDYDTGRFKRSLYDMDVGLVCHITELRAEPAVCQRLREMGFCEFAKVCKIAHSEFLICRVCEARVALSDQLARNIFVESMGVSSVARK